MWFQISDFRKLLLINCMGSTSNSSRLLMIFHSPNGQKERDELQQRSSDGQAQCGGQRHLHGHQRVEETGHGQSQKHSTWQQDVQQWAEHWTGKRLNGHMIHHLMEKHNRSKRCSDSQTPQEGHISLIFTVSVLFSLIALTESLE